MCQVEMIIQLRLGEAREQMAIIFSAGAVPGYRIFSSEPSAKGGKN
jgi:hypothetical protein